MTRAARLEAIRDWVPLLDDEHMRDVFWLLSQLAKADAVVEAARAVKASYGQLIRGSVSLDNLYAAVAYYDADAGETE